MAALAYRRSDPPSVHITVDDRRRRIDIHISGPVSGAQVSAPVSQVFVDRPELCAYDILYDLHAYSGDVGADDIDPIVEAYQACGPDASLPVRTAFLTPDPYFQHWASAMDEQFPGREHRAFPSLSAALAFLAVPHAQRRR
jgi:hypothetical protein